MGNQQPHPEQGKAQRLESRSLIWDDCIVCSVWKHTVNVKDYENVSGGSAAKYDVYVNGQRVQTDVTLSAGTSFYSQNGSTRYYFTSAGGGGGGTPVTKHFLVQQPAATPHTLSLEDEE